MEPPARYTTKDLNPKATDETYIQKNLGLRRDINYSDMGAAGKEAYNG